MASTTRVDKNHSLMTKQKQRVGGKLQTRSPVEVVDASQWLLFSGVALVGLFLLLWMIDVGWAPLLAQPALALAGMWRGGLREAAQLEGPLRWAPSLPSHVTVGAPPFALLTAFLAAAYALHLAYLAGALSLSRRLARGIVRLPGLVRRAPRLTARTARVAFHVVGALALATTVSSLVTGVHGFEASPLAENLVATAARATPGVYRTAMPVIEAYCKVQLDVDYMPHRFVPESTVRELAKDMGAPMALNVSAATAPRLNILDTGAYLDVFCSEEYLVEGTAVKSDRPIVGVGGAHRATAEATFRVPVYLDDGGVRYVHRRGLLVPECPHNLLSGGSMARDGEIGICIGRGGDESYITFADGGCTQRTSGAGNPQFEMLWAFFLSCKNLINSECIFQLRTPS